MNWQVWTWPMRKDGNGVKLIKCHTFSRWKIEPNKERNFPYMQDPPSCHGFLIVACIDALTQLDLCSLLDAVQCSSLQLRPRWISASSMAMPDASLPHVSGACQHRSGALKSRSKNTSKSIRQFDTVSCHKPAPATTTNGQRGYWKRKCSHAD